MHFQRLVHYYYSTKKIKFEIKKIILFLFFLTATVECYNPRTNEWTYVAKMNEPHYGHAGTVYGGVMYISGRQLPCEHNIIMFIL